MSAYARAVTAPELPRGVAINVASGVPRRIGDVLDARLGLSRVAIRIERDETLMRPSDVPVTAVDARAASWAGDRRSPGTSLEDMLDFHRRAV